MSAAGYTPPLGYAPLTPLYDHAIGLLTREREWRAKLVELVAPKAGDRILDVGSGTGSLGMMMLEAEPACHYRGIDPDERAVSLAKAKARSAGLPAIFDVGFLSDKPLHPSQRCNVIVSSLVFHQVPAAEKKRLLQAMHEWLEPGGLLVIADYGPQRSLLMRTAYRLTVQLLDGFADTQANADGILMALARDAGLMDISTAWTLATPTGSIDILCARKAGRQ